MTRVHHLNCGTIEPDPQTRAVCHCVLLQDTAGLALIDTGLGLEDVRDPIGRFGQPLIDAVGFRFDPAQVARRQIEALGLRPSDVRHIILTHADPDHAGGVADFPDATVHIPEEELAALSAGAPRYLPVQFAHSPKWKSYSAATPKANWFGLDVYPVDLGFASRVYLVPLFGHTAGHCGVAIEQTGHWLLHAGDTYYVRGELDADEHPVSQLSSARAADNTLRVSSLNRLRRLRREHGAEVRIFGYHDPNEMTVAV